MDIKLKDFTNVILNNFWEEKKELSNQNRQTVDSWNFDREFQSPVAENNTRYFKL